MKKNRIIFNCFKCSLLVLLFLPFTVSAQTYDLDSLLKVVKIMKEDTSKVNTYHLISFAYYNQIQDLDKVKIYARKELILSYKLNYKNGIARACMDHGIYYRENRKLDWAIYYDQKALSILQELQNKIGESSCYINMALSCSKQGNYKEATAYLKKAIKLKEELNDKGVTSAYNNLAVILQIQGNYEEALRYHLKALKINEERNDNIAITKSYINIGLLFQSQKKTELALGYYMNAAKRLEKISGSDLGKVYNNIGNVYMEREQLKESLIFHMKALRAYEKINDKLGMASSYNNIGSIYLKQNQPNSALFCHLRAYSFAKEINDKKMLVYITNSLGSTYVMMKNYRLAEAYYKETLTLAKQIDFKEGLRDAYEGYSDLYKKQSEFEKALAYMVLFNKINDSILDKEKFKQITELNTRYEMDKKEQEILLLTRDQQLNAKIIKQQQTVRWALIIVLCMLFISVVSIYWRYRFKQKANIILESQKKEIEQTVQELTKATDELHKVVEQKEKLTSILAHDLRTPLRFLSTISGYLYKNAATISLEELQELSAELSTSSKSTFAFADELLTWLSIQKNNYKTEYTGVNLEKLLNELSVFFTDIARTKNTKIHVSADPGLCIQTDERLLKIILRNIMDNAIKNTDEGVITLSVFKNETGINVTVKDTGCGMTKEELDKLIEINTFGFAFEIRDKLGFQIVRDLANLIHCKIQLESRLGKGTTVGLQFGHATG